MSNINDLDLHKTLLDEKSYETFLIYDVALKTSYGAKSLNIVFDKVDEYIKRYDETKYVALFHSD